MAVPAIKRSVKPENFICGKKKKFSHYVDATRLNLTGILLSTYSHPEIITKKAEGRSWFMSTTEALEKTEPGKMSS